MASRAKALRDRLLPVRKQQREELRRTAEAEAAEQQREQAERKRAERIAARRKALLEGDTDLAQVTVEGRPYFGRRVRSFTAAEASARNLSLVTDAALHAGVEYFLVPGRSPLRHVIGIRLEDRKALLESLRELYPDTALYAMRPGRESWPADAALYADGALPTALKRQDTIRFGEILLSPGGHPLADLSYGCDVEFWREGDQLLTDAGNGDQASADRISGLRTQAPSAMLAGALVAPRLNAVSDVVPAEARIPATRSVAGREHPTWADFFQPRLDGIDFPLDVVYTWVDGTDPDLAAKREAHRSGGRAPRINARETGASRYTSYDELKYSLRSLEMYAPFVRNVYIVTDGQTPSWLDTGARGIQVVDHKDVFADPAALPVFNSHAIGTQLHHVDGLSEHYLYFNDDVFLGRPVTAGHFFHGNGIAKLPFSPFQLGLGSPHPEEPAPNSAGKNVRKLLLQQYGRMTVNKFMHTPHPQIRSVMREIETLFAEDVERTSRSRFRDTTDIAMGASLHHHHAYLTGRAVPGTFKLRYIDVARPEAPEQMAELLATRRFDFFCLNDVNTPAEQQERIAAELHTFLESYFPFASRWERRPGIPAPRTGRHDAAEIGRREPSAARPC
ncbi:stealth conserved region 3 domain-containing protein [Streptomyces meridianus]|uniref:Stealth family protein n=1 Tax=Streptomyces meridianus TaxID=2938945 RepID=A0ABT0X808_9ACTN|nr:stealth conserved region 3 domain-containing protein [Streptomyces meridianus]MCM2578662.1 stealth family protein [Streptomyces meridianus]